MPIRVQDDKGNIHVFPDGSTPEMIAGAMGVQVSTQKVPQGQLDQIRQLNANQTQFEKNSAPAPAAYGFTPGNLVKNVGRGLSELGQGVVQGLDDVGGAILPQALGGDPFTKTKLVEHIVQPMQDEAAKARELQAQGQPYVGHAMASGIPLIGPYAANLGDQAAKGDIGGMVARAGTQYAAPLVASKVVPVALKAAGDYAGNKIAPRLYQSALKPSTTLKPWQRESMVETGLKQDIPVSETGLAKLNSLLNDLNQQVSDVVASSPNRTVNKFAVAKRLNDVTQRFSNQVAPTSDINTIAEIGNDFLANSPGKIRVGDAQAAKVGTYQQIQSRAYGSVKTAQIEAEKALARGLKEELETQFPELRGLNAQEGNLLGLEPALTRAIGRISNHNVIGIGTPIAGGATAAVTGSSKAGALFGTMKAVIDNPMVKSKLAIAISKSSKGTIPLSAAQARVGAYVAALDGASQDESQR